MGRPSGPSERTVDNELFPQVLAEVRTAHLNSPGTPTALPLTAHVLTAACILCRVLLQLPPTVCEREWSEVRARCALARACHMCRACACS